MVEYGGGGAAAVEKGATLELGNASLVAFNGAKQGGGVFASHGHLLLFDSDVEENTADEGRAIFWSCGGSDDASCNQTMVRNTTFRSNQAIGGGLLYEGGAGAIDSLWPALQDARATNNFSTFDFDTNVADYGQILASAPAGVVVTLVGELWSGEEVQYSGSTLVASIQDRYGQTLKDVNGKGHLLDGIVFGITTDQANTILLQHLAPLDPRSGNATFNRFVVEIDVGANVNLTFTAPNPLGLSTNLSVALQPCRRGDIPTNTNRGKCITCIPGEYSVVRGATECLLCEAGAMCYGGADIRSTYGYWNAPNKTSFYRCPFESCKGGVTTSVNTTCNAGYTGRLCAVCEPAHRLSAAGCLPCESDDGAGGITGSPESIVLLMLFALIGVCVLVCVYRCAHEMLTGSKQEEIVELAQTAFECFDEDNSGILGCHFPHSQQLHEFFPSAQHQNDAH